MTGENHQLSHAGPTPRPASRKNTMNEEDSQLNPRTALDLASGSVTDSDIERLASLLEDVIFDAGYSIKGTDLRQVLREELQGAQSPNH